MHEMALAEGVLQLCEDHARKAGATSVVAVWLEIGTLSHVEPEALEFCFEAVVNGTLAHGARLEIDRVPGCGWCYDCSREVAVNALIGACPKCGGYRWQVTGGQEMRVKEMEVT